MKDLFNIMLIWLTTHTTAMVIALTIIVLMWYIMWDNYGEWFLWSIYATYISTFIVFVVIIPIIVYNKINKEDRTF